MNLNQFEALYWIGRLGTFHAAARHLKTSQPAISGRIRDLERELGVELFDRSQRSIRLTPKGQELLAYAAEIIGITERVRQTVGAPEVVAGRVRLGVTGVAAMTWARTLVGDMAVTHPQIQVDLTVEASELLAEQIEEGHLDLAVLAGPVESSRVVSERLGRVPLTFLASPSLGVPEGTLSAVDIARFPVISDRPGTWLHATAMAWFRVDGVEPHRHHACSSLSVRIQLAAQGLGVALAAASAATRELDSGALRLLPTQRSVPPIEYVMSTPAFGMTGAVRTVAETAKLLIARKPNLAEYYSAAERMIHLGFDQETIS